MNVSKLASFALCGLLVSSSASAGAIFDSTKAMWVAYASVVVAATYYVCKAEPDRPCDLSLAALQERPLEWFEDALGNREVEIKKEARLDKYGQPVYIDGQEGRGLLGLPSKYEDAMIVFGVFMTLKAAHEVLESFLENFVDLPDLEERLLSR